MYYNDFYEQELLEDIKVFYNNLNKVKFRLVSQDRIDELRILAKKIKRKATSSYDCYPKIYAYKSMMNTIRVNPNYQKFSQAERYLLFMFSVDYDLEALTLFDFYTKNNKYNLKLSMISKFGIFDINLIKLENYYIKNIAPKQEKENVKQKIVKRG